MKLAELFESPSSPQEATFLKSIQPFEKNLKTFLDGDAAIFRGVNIASSKLKMSNPIKTDSSFTWTTVSGRSSTSKSKVTGVRNSRTGNNFFIDLTQVLPSWKNFPIRKLSNSSTSNEHSTSDFGKRFLIIPADNVTKFARTPIDFNLIKIGGGELMRMSHRLEVLTDLYKNKSSRPLDMQSVQGINEFCEWVDTIKSNPDIPAELAERFVTNFLRDCECKSLKELLFDKMTPESLGVKLFSSFSALLNDVKESETESDEIWFEGDYLAIDHHFQSNNQYRNIIRVQQSVASILS